MRKARFATMCATVALASNLPLAPLHAQATDPYLGQLMLVGFNFCPRGWANASGQIVSIAQNTALFSLLGTQYGGNGQTTFQLPDLRSRVPISFGQGPGLSNYVIGETGGVETVTLTVNQMPIHNHTGLVQIDNATAADTANPNGNAIARGTSQIYSNNTAPVNGVGLHPNTLAINNAGGSQPHENRMPYLAMNWCIATQGIFPPRN